MAFISIEDPQNPQNQHIINLDNVVSIKREVHQQTRDGYEHVVVIAHTYSGATTVTYPDEASAKRAFSDMIKYLGVVN
ncbi:hypothetical protein GCM10027348_21650 [Hymenobacter tenuis]